MDVSPSPQRILEYLDLPKLATQNPKVSAIAVTSLDGRAAINGVSGGLGNTVDARIFNTHRALADVVFVGSTTISAEEYGPVEIPPPLSVVRRQLGKTDTVPIATISRRLNMDPQGPLFTSLENNDDHNAAGSHATSITTSIPTNDVIIFTTPPSTTGTDCAIAWGQRRKALAAAGAEIIELPELSAHSALTWLKERGFTHIACEGGPSIYEQLLRAGDITDLYLTLAPWWVGSGPATLYNLSDNAQSSNDDADLTHPRQLRLADTIVSDSHIFLHYLLAETH